MNIKTINLNNFEVLKKNFESYLTIIYDNNSYLNETSEQNYKYIIKIILIKKFRFLFA